MNTPTTCRFCGQNPTILYQMMPPATPFEPGCIFMDNGGGMQPQLNPRKVLLCDCREREIEKLNHRINSLEHTLTIIATATTRPEDFTPRKMSSFAAEALITRTPTP